MLTFLRRDSFAKLRHSTDILDRLETAKPTRYTFRYKKGNSRARSYDINDLLRFVHSWFIRKSLSSYTVLLCVRSLPSFKSIGEQISKFYVMLLKVKPILFPHILTIVNYFSMIWIKTLIYFLT